MIYENEKNMYSFLKYEHMKYVDLTLSSVLRHQFPVTVEYSFFNNSISSFSWQDVEYLLISLMSFGPE